MKKGMLCWAAAMDSMYLHMCVYVLCGWVRGGDVSVYFVCVILCVFVRVRLKFKHFVLSPRLTSSTHAKFAHCLEPPPCAGTQLLSYSTLFSCWIPQSSKVRLLKHKFLTYRLSAAEMRPSFCAPRLLRTHTLSCTIQLPHTPGTPSNANKR